MPSGQEDLVYNYYGERFFPILTFEIDGNIIGENLRKKNIYDILIVFCIIAILSRFDAVSADGISWFFMDVGSSIS